MLLGAHAAITLVRRHDRAARQEYLWSAAAPSRGPFTFSCLKIEGQEMVKWRKLLEFISRNKYHGVSSVRSVYLMNGTISTGLIQSSDTAVDFLVSVDAKNKRLEEEMPKDT
jgi:hypothetical protein